MHTFNVSTQEERQVDLHEFKDSLVYKASSMPAGTTGQDPVSKDCWDNHMTCFSIFTLLIQWPLSEPHLGL